MSDKSIMDIFKDDLHRMEKMVKQINLGDDFIRFDYSKTHLQKNDLKEYEDCLEKLLVRDCINAMFKGEKINFTENRKVLHVALRNEKVLMNISLNVQESDLKDEHAEIYDELIKIQELSSIFTNGKLLGANGKALKTIVNIGIGGSDLGPRMVCKALENYHLSGVNVHFISNIDPTEILNVFEKIDPDETLFIVVSKTFTTQETLENAKLARQISAHRMKVSEELAAKHHFIAVSSNKDEVKNFGIETMFSMGDYVGGRYSLWSAAGVSIALYIGFENFIKLLKGASLMDEHFKNTDLPDNIPIMHAITELYYNNKCLYDNKCVLAYDQYLEKLPSYLQQAEMESNGKTATKQGKTDIDTGMIIWGDIGTNAQHSFFQLIHQGTRKILCEFVVGLTPSKTKCERIAKNHEILFANCVAQAEALMIGKEDSDANKNFPGNKPSIFITYSKLTPVVLGALIAMYEHKIFVQGLCWQINSYDQFGVELGKKLAKTVLSTIQEEKQVVKEHDPSTNALLELKNKHKKQI
ncbi:hypothetical protein BDAP_001441 [Binucleata daphniae]